MLVDPKRMRIVHEGAAGRGPVVSWMGRDMRAGDNAALATAQEIALDRGEPLVVAFTLARGFRDAPLRAYDFLLRGLEEVEEALGQKHIPFVLLTGDPAETLPKLLRRIRAGLVVSDFEPLTPRRAWKQILARRVDLPHIEVDARNVVPCWIASDHREVGARTLRPKIGRLLEEFLVLPPALKRHPHAFRARLPKNDWKKIRRWIAADPAVAPVEWCPPGETAAHKALRTFVQRKLARYAEDRNDPTKEGQSNLSPYLHFGHLSAIRVALAVKGSGAPRAAKEAFLEELIVRRELSDNFCFFTPSPHTLKAAPEWAQRTLAKHARDRRPYRYSYRTLESARTHDALWNAAQMEMVLRGKMHGYLRMYWSKKILEWSPSAATAIRTAIRLNDRFELDGRDANGYAGILWAIGGLHDRPWPERKLFGTVRFMSEAGCRKKFDADAYIDRIARLP